MIKEVIVVEGKDDVAAVKAAVDAEVIITHGFGYGKKLIALLRDLNERRGIIIFTDPDFMGNKIRNDISGQIKGAKHAFLPQGKAKKKDDIGVENATVEDIREAIKKARPEYEEKVETFTKKDLIDHGLMGMDNSAVKREKVSEILKIGHGNSKQFLNRLNSFKVTREEFIKAVKAVEDGKAI
ncbi:ribonuclease M5 [Anaerosphaera multitolerans]|uniref:Ribonuclease M5 n=1 Tax=Anaerosphaera multitolerans TaxID=2487351 RepID=A0A437S4I9_9FIRM|nr:ribonuclease M5 [Anaerosphaera multitolerans]RVU53898.1 ribonuclease M5 [Anaerosphaera multitolerans]